MITCRKLKFVNIFGLFKGWSTTRIVAIKSGSEFANSRAKRPISFCTLTTRVSSADNSNNRHGSAENSSASAQGDLCSWDVTSARKTRSPAFSQTSRGQRGKREHPGTGLKIADVSQLILSPRVFCGSPNDCQRYIMLNICVMSVSDWMKNK